MIVETVLFKQTDESTHKTLRFFNTALITIHTN